MTRLPGTSCLYPNRAVIGFQQFVGVIYRAVPCRAFPDIALCSDNFLNLRVLQGYFCDQREVARSSDLTAMGHTGGIEDFGMKRTERAGFLVHDLNEVRR